MFWLVLAAVLVTSLLGCSPSNGNKQKPVVGSDNTNLSQNANKSEPTPNTPPTDPTKQNDRHTENLTKPAPHTPTPQEGPASTGQGGSTETHNPK
jgi:cell division protein FtsN